MQLPFKPTAVAIAVQTHIACVTTSRSDLAKPLNYQATESNTPPDPRPVESISRSPGCIEGGSPNIQDSEPDALLVDRSAIGVIPGEGLQCQNWNVVSAKEDVRMAAISQARALIAEFGLTKKLVFCG